MKNFIMLLAACLLAQITFAQTSTEIELPSVEKRMIKINFISPGFSYEHGLTDKFTLDADAGINMTFTAVTSGGEIEEFNAGVVPYFQAQGRFYYNLEKRLNKGKNIRGNSGNFIALHSKFSFPPIGTVDNGNTSTIILGPVWGLQRTFKQGLNIEFCAGLGYGQNIAADRQSGFVAPIVQFRFGYVIGGRK